MTLDDALGLAEAKNEQIAIATAGITRAEGEEMRARSEIFPQFSASASYDRALATQFEGIFDTAGPACTPLTVNPAAPIADRIAEIERALQDCPPSSNFFGGGSGGRQRRRWRRRERERAAVRSGQHDLAESDLFAESLLGRTHRRDSASARGSRARIPS